MITKNRAPGETGGEDMLDVENRRYPGHGNASWHGAQARSLALAAWFRRNVYLTGLVRLLQALPLGKDLMLVVSNESTWNRIVAWRRGWVFSLLYFLLPALVFSGAIEAAGLFHYGQAQAARGLTMGQYTLPRLVVFELVQAAGLLCLVLMAALSLKNFGNACHARNDLADGLLVMTHAMGPLVCLQALNGIPGMSVWITWPPGIVLVGISLYHGLPRIMRPDPPSAMGLFVAGSAVVVLLSLLWRLMTYWYFTGDFKAMERLINGLTERLPLL